MVTITDCDLFFYFGRHISLTSSRYVSPSEWPPSEKNFPLYCDGPVYFFQPAVADKLLAALEGYQQQIFWLEDVFVTGE